MKRERLFLFLSLILIFLLLLLTEFQKPILTGEIKTISGNFPIRIRLVDKITEILIFDKDLKLKEGNKISVYGSKQSELEVIANRVECSNC